MMFRRLWCYRMVMEKRTSIWRQTLTMAWVYQPLSARMVSGPVAPAWHTRPTVSRRKWAAPRGVLARPLRSRHIGTSPVTAATANSE